MRIKPLLYSRSKNLYIAWAAFFVLLITITIVLPFNGLYGQDSYEYLRFSRHLQRVILNGEWVGEFFYPVLYPLIGALFGFIFPNLAVMQGVSLISFFIIAWYLYRILQTEYPGNNELQYIFISIFFLCSPYMLRASLVVMSDMLALLFIIAMFFQFQAYHRKGRPRTLVFFGLLMSFAISTRYAASVLVFAPFVVLVFQILIIRKRIKHFMLLLLAVSVGFIPQLLIKGISLQDIGAHPLWLDWSIGNMFANEFDIVEGQLQYALPNIIYPIYTWIHPGFFVIGLPLLFFVRRADVQHSLNFLLLGSFILYAVFLAGVPFQNMRFLILAFPLVLLFLFPAFKRAYHALMEYNPTVLKILLPLLLIVQVGLTARAVYPFWRMNKIERSISKEILKLKPQKLYTFAMDVPLRSYEAPFPIVNLRHDSIDNASTGDYVLFNEPRLQEQWQGKILMNNWEKLNDRFELKEVHHFDQNWTLYELR